MVIEGQGKRILEAPSYHQFFLPRGPDRPRPLTDKAQKDRLESLCQRF